MQMVRASFLVVGGFSAGVAIVALGCSYDWTFKEATPVEDGGGGTSEDTRPGATGSQCKGPGDCLPGQYCRFSDRLCGPDHGGGIGVCVDAAQPCTDTAGKSSCACDGTTVANACAAAKDGLDVDPTGAACSGVDRFKCPGVSGGCKRLVEYCLLKGASGSCVKFAPGCSDGSTCTTCKEISALGCPCDDTSDPPNGLTVTCK